VLSFTEQFGFIKGIESDQVFLFDRFERDLQILKHVVSVIDEGPAFNAAWAFNSLLHPGFRLWMDTMENPPTMQVIPTTLYGALMVQAAQEIAGIVKFRKCKQCPEWFPLGKSKGTTRKEFCSDRCRVAWHRHNIREDAR
jgi:hypothetical protein